MSRRFLITLITILVIGLVASVAIFFAKGYSISTKEKRIVGTGIVTIKSEPDAASVFIDGHLTTATNATISSLSPRTYSIKVVKEGFIPWEKSITVKEGLVNDLKVTLYPSIPTIYPLTFTGASNPVLSPDGSKLVYVVSSSSAKRNGVWVWTMSNNQPIAFIRSSEPHQIASNINIDFSKATLRWSPDSKQVLATTGNNSYLLESDNLNSEPRDITPTLSGTINSWEEDTKAKKEAGISGIKDNNLRKIASDSAIVRWSPDETKFMVAKSSSPSGAHSRQSSDSLKANSETNLKTEDSYDFKVYDLEGRESSGLSSKSLQDSSSKKEYSLPPARAHLWLPDSRHIILIEDKTISLIEFDGTNKAVIYAGTFDDNFVFPWPDSSRLVIVSFFPTPTASEPNLYGINLK